MIYGLYRPPATVLSSSPRRITSSAASFISLTAAGRDRGDDAPVPVPTGGGLYRLASGAALPASLLSSRPLLSEQEGLLAVRAEHQQRQSSAAVGSGGAGDTCLDGTTTKVISFVLGCGADRSDMEMRSSCAEDAARFPKRELLTTRMKHTLSLSLSLSLSRRVVVGAKTAIHFRIHVHALVCGGEDYICHLPTETVFLFLRDGRGRGPAVLQPRL